MKKEIPISVIIGGVVVLLIAVIAFGIRVLNPPEPQREQPAVTGGAKAAGARAGGKMAPNSSLE